MRRLAKILAACFVVQVVLVLTGPPGFLVDWLTGKNQPLPENPRYVAVLGGGGVPSETTLLRLWHAAQFGAGKTGVTFIVALPADDAPEENSVGRMRDELVLRGIPADSIRMETQGLSTRQQAANIARMVDTGGPIVVVTSGFHVRRAVLCFRKAGFTSVAPLFAYSTGAEADAGRGAWLRYGVWNNAVHEIEICRELLALVAYKLRGWI